MDEVTCRILRDNTQIYSSHRRGIAPLIEVIEGGINAVGCVAYDTIVGRAAALLYVLMGVKQVNAGVISAGAVKIFNAHGIAYTYGTLTESIINRTNTGVCPMEQAVEGITSPQAALEAVKQKLKQLSGNN